MEKTIKLNDKEVLALKDMILSDIQLSSFDVPDFADVDLMQFYATRAQLLAMLYSALKEGE